MKRFPLTLFFAITFFLAGCPKDSEKLVEREPFVKDNKVKLGLLFPLTGDWASQGAESKIAAEIAIEDLKPELQKSNLSVEPILVDTKTSPSEAFNQIQELDKQGVRVVIGPATSEEVVAVLEYANNHGIMVVSHASTAPFLATVQNNLFRLTPNDIYQAGVLSDQMQKNGHRFVVALARDDVWGEELRIQLEKALLEKGGRLEHYIAFDPTFKAFDSQLDLLNRALEDAIAKNNATPDNFAIQLLAFDESAEILETAADTTKYPTLSKVQWYGADGFAQSAAVIENPAAAQFALDRKLVATSFHIKEEEHATYDPFAKKVAAANNGKPPAIYAGTTYDAILLAVQTSKELNQQSDDAAWRKKIVELSSRAKSGPIKPVTGDITLDDSGERATATYELWKIQKNPDNSYSWVETGLARD